MKNHTFVRIAFLFLSAFFIPQSAAFAQATYFVVPLWENGAPGFESRRNEPEISKDWWVKNIHNPSLMVYLPEKEKANGAAVVVCPGGGHSQLVINPEGRDPAMYLNGLGVTAIVLKYRLIREENSPYTMDHVKQDVYRAMRMVRSHAKEWNIDPSRIGILGFSAGGEVAALVAYAGGSGDPNAPDPVDRLNAKPNFQMLVYPGPNGIPDVVPPDAPPAFMVAANDDECCSEPIVKLIQRYRAARVPMEAHLYAQGKHAFNMGDRSQLNSIKTWPQRMADWLSDNGWLTAKK
ncbi:MAG TPA: alpha/beta hydrolase [Bacteroidota bacterium]|nr:alpha/beta hydrolase [Bacteroidota bacterium]